MNEVEALQILIEIRPLALKLTDTNLNFQPTEVELVRLEHFRQLCQAGYTYAKLKFLAARVGLAPSDLGILNWFSAQAEYKHSQASSSQY